MFNTIEGLVYSYCDNINDASQKLAYFVPLEDVLTYVTFCNALGNKLDQILFSIQIGYATFKNNFVFQLLQSVTSQLIPSGIPQYLNYFYSTLIFKKHNVKKLENPTVLTLEDLEIGFKLWIFSCLLTFVSFALELMLSFFLRKLKIKIFKNIKQTLAKMILGLNLGTGLLHFLMSRNIRETGRSSHHQES